MVYKQKIKKIGNSYGVVLPKPILEALSITPDSEIFLEIQGNMTTLMTSSDTPKKVSAEFLSVAQQVVKKYKNAFTELSSK